MRIPEMSSYPYVTLFKSEAILICKIYLWLTWRENGAKYCLLVFLKFCNTRSCCFTPKVFNMSAKEKEMIVTKMSLSYCNYVILNQRSSCNQHTQTHMICARNNELGKSGEQMSSVPDQLQRVVGKSHNAAFQADNKHVQGGDGGSGDGRRVKSREGWIREWNGTRVGDTCRETLWNFVSCKEESVCACETDGQTEAVFSSCRPRCYVSSMWHIQPVHGAKTQQLPPHPPPPLLTQTRSLGRPSASGHNLILLYLVWSVNKASYLNLPLLWKNGNDKNK